MMYRGFYALLFLSLINASISKALEGSQKAEGKKWAVLIAGSRDFWNYRHQADVCHAYQILKSRGLKDENIVVFMYDDIAFHPENPRPGVIINKPDGRDVYKGVPKDYTGDAATAENLFSVLLGNKSTVKGGSGKVVNSGPNDQIFIFYSDHGAPGIVLMPSGKPIYAQEFVDVLKRKHAAKAFESMVIYMEACAAGSIFEGLLPKDSNIYVTTASNAMENSYAAYCPGDVVPAPPEYNTCLGDLFSISWLEDSDQQNLNETLKQQYELVKKRTLNDDGSCTGSHVMQYGDLKLQENLVSTYIGTNSRNGNNTLISQKWTACSGSVSQYDADLLYFVHKLRRAPKGSDQEAEAYKHLLNQLACRKQVEQKIYQIGNMLLGEKSGSLVMKPKQLKGKPLVNDWEKFKALVETFEEHCGPLKRDATKIIRAIANICNLGISVDQMVTATAEACREGPRNSC